MGGRQPQGHHIPNSCCIRTQPLQHRASTSPRTPLTAAPTHQRVDIRSETPWNPQSATPGSSPLTSRWTLALGHARPHTQPRQELDPLTIRPTLDPGPPAHNHTLQNKTLPTRGPSLAPGLPGACGQQLMTQSHPPVARSFHKAGPGKQPDWGPATLTRLPRVVSAPQQKDPYSPKIRHP